MLTCFQSSFDQAGRSKAAIARDCEMTVQHLYKLFSGKLAIPKHRRARIDRAFQGFPVNWEAYEAEMAALSQAPTEAPKIKAAPHRPASAPSRSPVAGKWGEPVETVPKPKAAPPAPPKAKGFFANLIKDDEEDVFG